MSTIEAPRSASGSGGKIPSEYKRTNAGIPGLRPNFEMIAWLFMRISGVVLVVLIFAHLFSNLVAGEGVKQIDFGFVAGKWAGPFWQIWDLVLLWLAMLHGTNGLRTIINDYAESTTLRAWLKGILYVASATIIVLGTLVIFTFDPCPPSADPSLLPSFCPAP
ncbi:succinate dehydrogenase hydrophobic membrane anchor subunit [Haematomicrobium sanguinis]|uniref:succinate dehydrogenase hydrophobic membrane anchor subunit n=1 Tax=Haematomicrobium sanguinis TaxID=479106 RepID=UPI00047CF45A|nr:succinate dehydrogenase hydrophobic membrane anchor subunit [Haematomicrobium sanguinis]